MSPARPSPPSSPPPPPLHQHDLIFPSQFPILTSPFRLMGPTSIITTTIKTKPSNPPFQPWYEYPTSSKKQAKGRRFHGSLFLRSGMFWKKLDFRKVWTFRLYQLLWNPCVRGEDLCLIFFWVSRLFRLAFWCHATPEGVREYSKQLRILNLL